MYVQAKQCIFFPSDPFLQVKFGSSPGLNGLVNCKPARLIAFHSLIPAAPRPIRAQYVNEERACHFRAGVQGAHGVNIMLSSLEK